MQVKQHKLCSGGDLRREALGRCQHVPQGTGRNKSKKVYRTVFVECCILALTSRRRNNKKCGRKKSKFAKRHVMTMIFTLLKKILILFSSVLHPLSQKCTAVMFFRCAFSSLCQLINILVPQHLIFTISRLRIYNVSQKCYYVIHYNCLLNLFVVEKQK